MRIPGWFPSTFPAEQWDQSLGHLRLCVRCQWNATRKLSFVIQRCFASRIIFAFDDFIEETGQLHRGCRAGCQAWMFMAIQENFVGPDLISYRIEKLTWTHSIWKKYELNKCLPMFPLLCDNFLCWASSTKSDLVPITKMGICKFVNWFLAKWVPE